MEDYDVLKNLRESYKEVLARKNRLEKISDLKHSGIGNIATIRRYLRYTLDILDVYLDIQRDRRYRGDW